MPNGDYHEHLPLDVEVKNLMERCDELNKALRKTIEVAKAVIEENKQIRDIANLPSREYPEKISVGNTHWSL